MDRFEGRCHLDWWANSSMNLGGDAVHVVITSDDDGWHAEGRFLEHSESAHEGFTFLCELDPVFDLRFEDGSTIAVTVHPLDAAGRFTLTEPTGPSASIDYVFDLTGPDGGPDGQRAVK